MFWLTCTLAVAGLAAYATSKSTNNNTCTATPPGTKFNNTQFADGSGPVICYDAFSPSFLCIL